MKQKIQITITEAQHKYLADISESESRSMANYLVKLLEDDRRKNGVIIKSDIGFDVVEKPRNGISDARKSELDYYFRDVTIEDEFEMMKPTQDWSDKSRVVALWNKIPEKCQRAQVLVDDMYPKGLDICPPGYIRIDETHPKYNKDTDTHARYFGYKKAHYRYGLDRFVKLTLDQLKQLRPEILEEIDFCY